MRRLVVPLFLVLFAAGGAACAHRAPPQELVDARAAYARAHVGPAVQANTPGLHESHRALEEAEREFAEQPSSDAARHLAYIAHRKILAAEANARATIAATQGEHARQTLAELNANAKLREKDDTRAAPPSEQKARVAPPH